MNKSRKGNIFGFMMYHERLLFRVIVASGKYYVTRRKFMQSRFVVTICVSTAVVRGKGTFLSGRRRDL